MKTQKIVNFSLLTAVIALLFAITSFGTMVSAQDVEQPVEVQTTSEQPETNEEVTTETYNYVAQAGDSYTKMARKATQTYGIETGTNLSGAQIVFVETNLTKAAGSPELSVGQEVSIEKNTVNEWVEKAKQLTDTQIKAWQVYADNVDFNTNSVGEPQN